MTKQKVVSAAQSHEVLFVKFQGSIDMHRNYVVRHTIFFGATDFAAGVFRQPAAAKGGPLGVARDATGELTTEQVVEELQHGPDL